MTPTDRTPATLVLVALAFGAPQAAAQDPPVFRSEVRMVEVYATVFDHKGRPVLGLTRESFVVTDNGVPQPIVSFEASDSDLNCALLLDVTGSMSKALPGLKRAVVSLIDELRAGDWVAVYGFRASLTLVQDFTQDKDLARQAVLHLRAGGQTALFDAITQVGLDLARRRGRKALVALTDGEDNASVLGSEAATARVRKVGVPLYAIAQGEALERPELLKTLSGLATTTGGLSFTAKRPEDVGEILARIYKDLSRAYMMGYPAPPVEDGKWRTIQVSVKGADNVKVRAKQGYSP